MKTTSLLWTCILCISFANAQTTPQSLLNELPPIPGNVCTEISQVRVKFENDIRAVEMKIEALQQTEKEARQAEEERCGFNVTVLQDEALISRMEALAVELESIQLRINQDHEQRIQEIFDIEEPLIRDFDDRMLILTQAYWEVQGEGGDVHAAREEIKRLQKVRCDTLSELKQRNIRVAYDLLMQHWAAYERMNALQDESARMCYIGYSVSSQHGGLLLDALDFYLEELRGAYQWHPSERPMVELGNEDDFK